MSGDEFNPHSRDAVTAKILEQIQGMREDFREYRADTEKRLRAVEQEASEGRGKTVIISAIASVGLSSLAAWFLKK